MLMIRKIYRLLAFFVGLLFIFNLILISEVKKQRQQGTDSTTTIIETLTTEATTIPTTTKKPETEPSTTTTTQTTTQTTTTKPITTEATTTKKVEEFTLTARLPLETLTATTEFSKVSLGRFKITGYTAEEGFYEGKATASGVGVGPGICAMNRGQMNDLGIKYGQKIYIEGLGTYTVQDCGCPYGVVDVWVYTDAEAYAMTGYYDVYLIR